MEKNLVDIDFNRGSEAFVFSPVFNVAVQFIDRHIEEGRKDKTAILTTDGREITYQTLYDNVNRVGNVLINFGLQRGDRILMVVKDCPEFFYLFWGAVKGGFIPVTINTILRAKDYQYFIDDSECSLIAYSAEYGSEVVPAIKKSRHLPAFIMEVGKEGNAIEKAMALASTSLVPAVTTAEDDCFIIYSSGSTGNPKGAVHRHKAMVVTANRMGVQTLQINQNDIFYSAAKLFFAYGMGNSMTFPLWCGGTVILCPERPTPELVSEIVEKHRPTAFFGVPTLYAGQVRLMKSKKVDFSSVRVCLSAGEGLPSELYHRWMELTGKPPLDGIGATENLNHFICNRIGKSKPGSSGQVVQGYTVKIIDENGGRAPFGEVGQLLVKGESIASRYWRNPEKTAATFIDGWLRTGDSYCADEEGFFYYCGRNDDMLKVGGIWCSPFEIESKLHEHPSVLEAAVIGFPDENNLIKPKAFVILGEQVADEEQLLAELQQLCKKELAPYKYPRWFEIVKDLPKTATGKIQRYQLRLYGDL